MMLNYFTQEQVEELKKNPYVKKVSSTTITYADSFKEHFISEYASGKFPTRIFREAGFDASVLGQARIQEFSRRVKGYAKRPEGVEDQRAYAPRTGRIKRTEQEEIDYLRHQMKVKDQQIEVLKKNLFFNRKAAMKRKKNSPSSNG